jgi:hypothetical protein
MCFEICDGRFLNEDGDVNQTLDDVATWLNFFYNEATIVAGGWGDDMLSEGAGNDVFRVTGNDADDCSFGGYDKYDGGAGTDRIVAYGGNVDIGLTAFSATNGVETIDATSATNRVRLLGNLDDNVLDFHEVGAKSMANLTITAEGKNTRIAFGGTDVLLNNVQVTKLTSTDFVF